MYLLTWFSNKQCLIFSGPSLADRLSLSPAKKKIKPAKYLHPPTSPSASSREPGSASSSKGGTETHQIMDSHPPKVSSNSQAGSSGPMTKSLLSTSPIALMFPPGIESSQRLPSTGDDTRDKCVELLHKAMRKGLDERMCLLKNKQTATCNVVNPI